MRTKATEITNCLISLQRSEKNSNHAMELNQKVQSKRRDTADRNIKAKKKSFHC